MLQAKALSCERGGRILFEDVSLSVSPGEVLRIEGANGSGKTTLLRILCGLYQDYEGEVKWDLPEHPIYLGHRPGVKDHLTARENLSWLAALFEAEVDDEEIGNALARFQLAGFEDMPCGSLSQGQRKRVNLARLCLLESPAWILDEPFSSIDMDGVSYLEQLIDEQVSGGGIVLLTSHQSPSISGAVQSVRLGE